VENEKIYLGDSVYCQLDGGTIKLTTETGCGVEQTIFLEPTVLDNLLKYALAVGLRVEDK